MGALLYFTMRRRLLQGAEICSPCAREVPFSPNLKSFP